MFICAVAEPLVVASCAVATPTHPAGSCFDGRPVDSGDFSALRSQWQTQDKQLFMKWYEVICCLWVWPGWCFTADNGRPLASLSVLRHRPPALLSSPRISSCQWPRVWLRVCRGGQTRPDSRWPADQRVSLQAVQIKQLYFMRQVSVIERHPGNATVWSAASWQTDKLCFLHTPPSMQYLFYWPRRLLLEKNEPSLFVWSHIGPQWCFSGVSHFLFAIPVRGRQGGSAGVWAAMCARWNTDSCLWPLSYTSMAIDTFQVHYVLWLQNCFQASTVFF